MDSPVPAEIRNDVWHLLLHMYAYQDKSSRIVEVSPTRYALSSEIVSLNALAESITLRVARLADRSKGVRSIKNFAKKATSATDRFQRLVAAFECRAVLVLDQRHETIAHMSVGTLSSYPIEPLKSETVACVEILVNLMDEYSGEYLQYTCSVGSQEKLLDLRQSVIEGCRINV